MELTEDLKWILGRPNFTCGRIARRLREMGYEIKDKSEDEQAVVIHTMMDFYIKHDKNWRGKFEDYLKKDIKQSKQPTK